jgi:DNA adenine methylase
MPYAGGKNRIAQQIADLLPDHLHYAEPFAGALSVLLAKHPSKIESVNDLDSNIANFWAVLRDRPTELERICALTPHSRAEWLANRNPEHRSDNQLQAAWQTWVALTQTRGSSTDGHGGWRFVQGGTTRHSLVRYLDGYLARIAPAAERLRQVSIDCRPAAEFIDCYDRPTTCYYIDPPYLADTRYGTQYRKEMRTETDHTALLDQIATLKANVIISGYRNQLYDNKLHNWRRIDLPTTCTSGAPRTESIWLNYDPPNQPALDIAPSQPLRYQHT